MRRNQFRLSAKRTSPFKSAGASVQSTIGSQGVRISGSNGSNAGCTMFRGSVKGSGYPLHSPVSPSLPQQASLHYTALRLRTLSARVMHSTANIGVWRVDTECE